MLAPLGTALLGGAVTGGAAAAAGTMAIFGPLAQGMLTIGAQKQQASMQAEAQKRATIAENARYNHQASAMRKQQATESLRLAQEVSAVNRASMEAMARKEVAAAEGGISLQSGSFLAEMRDLEKQVGEHNYATQQNQYLADQAYEMRARDLGLMSQQNYVNINKPIAAPNVLGTMLGAATQSLGNYTGAKRMQTRQMTPALPSSS
tara:strand:- start:1146 stop:1763 length:618 start_codon:yes stop_codon:yes gene_type:complete